MLFSVITPSFNQAQFLPDNLRSVAAQIHANVEHIIVDPGSTDGSRDIAAAAGHARLIAEPDRGQSDGICKGWAASTGDVLTWLNSDDFYPSDDVLAAVAKAFEDNPDADVIYGGVDFVGEDGEFLRKGFVNPRGDALLDSFEYQVGIVQPGVFIRRRVFETVGGPSENYEYCMDYEYWVRIAANGFKWVYLDKKLAHHRWWAGMKTSRGRDESLIEHFRVCQNYFGYIHWKWLDRYAEFLASAQDGVVNHAVEVDQTLKARHAEETIDRFVTQDALAKLERRETAETSATLDYLHRHDRGRRRYFREGAELRVSSETSRDPLALERVAWNIFEASTEDGRQFKAYHVPNNFDRYFEANWYSQALREGQARLRKLSENRKKTCIVVGNGPSLKLTDFELFDRSDVIISNYAIVSPDLAKKATILTIVNDMVARQGSVEFNALQMPKIVPFWLGNSINPTPETIFVPATVKPEFNGEINGQFSWRSTVSFFNMQLAFALGYEKVLLVGFDHSYAQPEGVKEGDAIDQQADDENHFDPRYFRGKTWQAADTAKMEASYVLAKAAYEAAGREIVNCTVGGKLELFRRADLAQELGLPRARPAPEAPPTEPEAQPARRNSPRRNRLLVFDMTATGNGTATGEIKGNLFGSVTYLQVCSEKGRLAIVRPGALEPEPLDEGRIEARIAAFRPDVILYRPVPEVPRLHRFAMEFIRKSNLPLVTWIMDDWLSALSLRDPASASAMGLDWAWLLERSAKRLSISTSMSSEMSARYGGEFIPVANGVDPTEWTGRRLLVRYGGGLAHNMGVDSVLRLARAVEALADAGYDARLEVLTKPYWYDQAASRFDGLGRTSFSTANLAADEYRSWLRSADVLAICYNFDDASLDYVRHSMANKLPECLASGAVVLGHGHPDIATIARLAELDCAIMVTRPDQAELEAQLRRVADDRDWAAAMAARAQSVAFDRFNLLDARQSLADAIEQARAEGLAGARTASTMNGFRDRHRNERCFILGNGPSLNQTDLSLLKDETVFASNGVDLLFDRIDWRPTYYACVDSRVLPDRADAVKAMLQANPDMTGFFPNRLTDHGGKDAPRDTRGLIGVLPNAVFFSERPNDPTRGVEGMFAFDLNDGLVQPYTVTITLMQLAAWMGFAEIVLIGCDTDYVVPVSVRQDGPSVEGGKLLLTSTADDDPNHFDPRYFGKDRQWHQPQVGKMIQHYQYAAQALASKGVRVVNATVGGKLEVFDRVDYGGLFERTSQPEIDVLIVRPDAVGRAAISRIPVSVPVMVLGDAPDLGQGLRADYLVGAMGAAAFSAQRLEVLCGDGSGLRRVLVDPGAGKTLMTSNRAMDVDFLLNVIWTDVDRATLSTTGLALLWAQALGYRAIGLGGATIGAALDASADIRDRVIQMGLSVAVIH